MPRAALAACLLALATIRTANAHDIPNARVDRAIQVDLEPGRLRVDYEVSLAELTLVQDLRALIGALPGGERRDWFLRYGEEAGPLNAKGLLVDVDGREIPLAYRSFDLFVEEHPRFVFHLGADIPPAGKLRLRDINYASSEGSSRLAFRAAPSIAVEGDARPEDVSQIPEKPPVLLSDEEERRTKELEIAYRIATSPAAPLRDEATTPPPPAPDIVPPRTAQTGLTALMDGHWSWWGGFAVALLLGLAHALQPGHGKALVAAASLGSRGGGVALAIGAALAHLAGVIGIALLLALTRSARYDEIDAMLVRAAGLLLALTGAWRLGHALGGPREATGSPTAGPPRAPFIAGLAAGAIPCWDAILLVLLADGLGRYWWGLFLLCGFSLGLALVLLAVALLAARLPTPARARQPLALAASALMLAFGLAWLFR